jgi:hypothetical protein
MRSPTESSFFTIKPRATGGRGVRYARMPRRTLCADAAAYARRPRRTLRSHVYQRASRKLSVHEVVLCASCSPLYCPGATRPRKACSRLASRFRSAIYCRRVDNRPGVRLARHRRRRQALRQHRCTARRIGGCDKHCDDNDAQPGRFSHGRRGRDVRYARTTINAHHVG